MELIRNLQNLGKKDIRIAGGKGASLGEMTKAGIPVPPGFVVLSGAFENFLEKNNLTNEISSIIGSIKQNSPISINNSSEKIVKLILNSKMSEDLSEAIVKNFKKLRSKSVAVRSSATAEDGASSSWAGQLESYLNTDEGSLNKNIKKCWASLFSPRAISYRFEKRLINKKISVAVIVENMIQSGVSGIVFTVHPVTGKKNRMIVEAGYGLGEAIVSGQITPDSFIVNKKNLAIMDRDISLQKIMIIKSLKGVGRVVVPKNKRNKQKLSDNNIIKLSRICLNIEKHNKRPQDIEWAIANNKIYILQSRPITTL